MAFPDDRLDVRAELLIAGAQVDVTGLVYTRDPITTTYGMGAEGTQVDPAAVTLTLNNKDGRFSSRNPNSPYFGKLSRNTPLRISVPGAESFLSLDGTAGQFASTPDAAGLDTAGDLDVRFEATLDWYAVPVQLLMGKWGATGQHSWLLGLKDGLLELDWSTTGSDLWFATRPMPALPTRAALRVTLDVNNGSGGATATFYSAGSLAGPWTQFAQPVVIAGTTSVFASTAPVTIGLSSGTALSMTGRVHRAELRTGLSGPVVAAPDFRAVTPGTTSFADSSGRTWTLTGAEISNREVLATVEVAKWPAHWAPSGRDVWTPIEGAGILRRMGQGKKPIASTLRRKIPTAPDLMAYWPLEDGADSSQAYSPVPGVQPMALSNVTWASNDTLASSGALPVLATSAGGDAAMMSGTVPAPPGPTTGWQVRWLYRLDSVPTTLWTLMRIRTTGTVAEWYIQARDTQSRILARDANGNTVFDQLVATGLDLFNQWNSINLRTSQSGGTVSWAISWQDVGGDFGSFTGSYSGTAGRVRGVGSPPSGFAPALDGMAIGHIGVFSTTLTNAYVGAITAYAGEEALDRLERLTSEEAGVLPLSWVPGDTTIPSAAMGPQHPATLPELLQECADADGGILAERTDRLGLIYRDRTSLYNQPPTVVLDYAAGQLAPPFEPVEDDQTVRNDITVTRDGGSSGQVVIEDGPLSIRPPEEGGVGLYDEAITLNLATDEQPVQIAGWRAHLGTWDEARYPSVTIRLHRVPGLIPDVLRLRIGDTIRVINTPSWQAPGPVDLMVRQIQHVPLPRTWVVTLVCTPAGPWQVGTVDDPVRGRVDTDGSVLATGITATASTMSVATADRPIWTRDPTDFPVDVRVGGEVMTITNITGAASPQTFTIGARSVNGITKAHLSLTLVELATPTIVAL